MYESRSSAIAIVSGLLLGWAVLGCQDAPPENPLPDDEVLISIICDLHEAEAAMNKVRVGNQDSVSLMIRERIAATHGISPEQMDLWLETLQRSPEHAIAVYDSVVARFERALK